MKYAALLVLVAGCSRLVVQPPVTPTMPGGCTLLRVAPVGDASVAVLALLTAVGLVSYGLREEREALMIGLAVPAFAVGVGFAWSAGGGFRDTAACRRAYGSRLPAGRYY